MGAHDLGKPLERTSLEDQTGDTDETSVNKPEETETENVKTEEGIGLDDVGKGLILLGGIILICYFVLWLISVTVQVEPGQMVWTMPGYMVPTLVISFLLIFAGLVIVAITRDDEGI